MRYAVFRRIPVRKTTYQNDGGGFHIEMYTNYDEAKETKGKIRKIPEELYSDVQGIINMFN
jgi:hypothetical protein